MWRPGPLEIALIAAVVILVFGIGKLPQAGGALGKAIQNFRKGLRGDDEDVGSEGSGSERNSGATTKRNGGA